MSSHMEEEKAERPGRPRCTPVRILVQNQRQGREARWRPSSPETRTLCNYSAFKVPSSPPSL